MYLEYYYYYVLFLLNNPQQFTFYGFNSRQQTEQEVREALGLNWLDSDFIPDNF